MRLSAVTRTVTVEVGTPPVTLPVQSNLATRQSRASKASSEPPFFFPLQNKCAVAVQFWWICLKCVCCCCCCCCCCFLMRIENKIHYKVSFFFFFFSTPHPLLFFLFFFSFFPLWKVCAVQAFSLSIDCLRILLLICRHSWGAATKIVAVMPSLMMLWIASLMHSSFCGR